MDAFISAFVALFIASWASPPQLLGAALAIRHRATAPIIAGMALSGALICSISALAGLSMHLALPPAMLMLVAALAVLAAGVSMLWRQKAVGKFVALRFGALPAALIATALVLPGDRGQMLIAAIAALSGKGIATAAGGWMGLMAALLPAIMLREALPDLVPMTMLRRAGAAGVLLGGLWWTALAAGSVFAF